MSAINESYSRRMRAIDAAIERVSYEEVAMLDVFNERIGLLKRKRDRTISALRQKKKLLETKRSQTEKQYESNDRV